MTVPVKQEPDTKAEYKNQTEGQMIEEAVAKEVKLSSQEQMYADLLAVQKELPSLQKSAINPHFKNKYVPLEVLNPATLEVLNKHNFVWLTLPDTLPDGSQALSYVLLHTPTGESIKGTMSLGNETNTPQAQGSAITYARRYALMAVLGLVADEDDDNQGQASKAKEPASESSKQNLLKALAALDMDLGEFEKKKGTTLDTMTQEQVDTSIAQAKTTLTARAAKA